MANVPFPHKLALNRFFLSLFGGHPYDLDQDTFREVTKRLTDESLEIREEDGCSRFLDELARLLPTGSHLSFEQLLDFDRNIARHTEAINSRRSHRIQWKYFQYLALLFTEIYLDWYFRDQAGLLAALNQHLEAFNNALLEWGENKREVLSPYTPESLRRIALWNATGSGKTLLMHINLAQYRHYLAKYKRTGELNRVLVLTPNEGLTHQHLEEFKLSGIPAAPFDKNSTGNSIGMFKGQIVDIIDMNKLREEGKKKTVSVDQFETNNLVFIDEAHRGSQGEVWSEMRSRLAKDGFTFEYSATLGQAVSSDSSLVDDYAKSILFDYSYRYFHADGFGKDYQILNIEGSSDNQADKERRQLYLTACLLSHYQQLCLFEDEQARYKAFAIEKPLWVFVGSKVTAIRTENKKQVSDVEDILLFFADLVKDRNVTVAHLRKLLSGNTGLLDGTNRDIFAEAFPFLQAQGKTAEQIFDGILAHLFNAPRGGALHVDYLVGGDGELALRLGTSDEPFGVVNVGDAKKLAELCEKHETLIVSEKPFSSSLFRTLNVRNSKLNVLIGSKRFSEGWNSYRVSTLGLMYVGQNEGSEIIQLFGRGVRLRGYANSLKRSRAIHWAARDKELDWVAKDHRLPILETLNVFGVKSDYMQRFNEFLEGEGIRRPDSRESIKIPVKLKLPHLPLVTVKVPDDVNFKKQAKASLSGPDEIRLETDAVTLDWYPRVAIKASKGIKITQLASSKPPAKLTEDHLAFIDFDAIYLELQQLKAERAWHNFSLSRDTLRELLTPPNNDWYTLYAPPETMAPELFEQVWEWTEIASALLKKYCDRFYKAKKDAYEAPHRIYAELQPDDPNFIEEYKILVDRSEKLIIQRLNELEQHIRDGVLGDFNIGGRGEALFFDRHLYSPLLHLRNGVDTDLFSITPVPLNDGERDFVVDLRTYFQSKPALLDGKEIYLLRNQSKGRGIGFFEAGNFYPDFLLWVLEGKHQHVIFVDPKGILRCEGLNDPKLSFYKTIKDIEKKLNAKGGSATASLHSFIVSSTPLGKVRWWDPKLASAEDFAARHVLFQRDAAHTYIETLFKTVLN